MCYTLTGTKTKLILTVFAVALFVISHQNTKVIPGVDVEANGVEEYSVEAVKTTFDKLRRRRKVRKRLSVILRSLRSLDAIPF